MKIQVSQTHTLQQRFIVLAQMHIQEVICAPVTLEMKIMKIFSEVIKKIRVILMKVMRKKILMMMKMKMLMIHQVPQTSFKVM